MRDSLKKTVSHALHAFFQGAVKHVVKPAAKEVEYAFGASDGAELPGESAEEYAVYWHNIPAVKRRHESLMCGGEPQRYNNFVEYAMERWGGKLPKKGMSALVLGCNDSSPLLHYLLLSGKVDRIVVVDGDREVLNEYAAHVPKTVECKCLDLNGEELPQGPYHLVLAYETLHRVAELESLFDRVAREMDFSAVFVMRDYTGPNRLQMEPEQIRLASAFLPLLPERLRTDVTGAVREEQLAPDLGKLMNIAPDLAVRSEDLLGVIKAKLKIVESMQLGGALLAPLFSGIARNFLDENDAEATAIADAMIETEAALTGSGMLPNNFSYVIARKQG
jgi:hypothetical protein